MKVAYLLGSLNIGGIETMMRDIVNHSDKSRLDFLGIYRRDGDMSDFFLKKGMSFIKLSPGSIWSIIPYIYKLRKIFVDREVKIIHTNQSIDTIYSFISTIGLGIKLVQTIHEFDYEIGKFGKIIKWISFKMADKTIFLNHFQKNHYVSAYSVKPSKTSIIFNGIDFKKFKPVLNKDFKHIFRLRNNILLLGMVGNFFPGKDQMTICKYLLLLKNAGVDFVFLFIGGKSELNPELFENCVTFCHNNNLDDYVRFTGKRQDIPEVLPILDAFIFSTNYDAFGNSVIEAFASKVPVFVNDWGVMKEITENGDKAIIYKTKDENDLFDKFLDFKSKITWHKVKAQEDYLWAQKRFSIENHMNQLFQLYSNLIIEK